MPCSQILAELCACRAQKWPSVRAIGLGDASVQRGLSSTFVWKWGYQLLNAEQYRMGTLLYSFFTQGKLPLASLRLLPK